ncbi:DUF4314 domain-containing protein [Actinomadura sp. SCN-SB]|uniref:DUF4314 domain-containing protein n=1 Tax=Actinomadura sp. SCN-SB TaxID=3373092 RepID=UPI003751078E
MPGVRSASAPRGPDPAGGHHQRAPAPAREPGALGTVTDDSPGTIQVRWDNSSTLGLIPAPDRFEVISGS